MLVFASVIVAAIGQTKQIDGRELFTDVRKGNCVACHQIPGDSLASGKIRIGPDLAGIKARYPDRARLRAAVWDQSETLPNTIMPPYGKHRILTETEIDAVVGYLETL